MSEAITTYITEGPQGLQMDIHEGGPGKDVDSVSHTVPNGEIDVHTVVIEHQRQKTPGAKIGQLTLQSHAEYDPNAYAIDGGLEPQALPRYGNQGVMTMATQLLFERLLTYDKMAKKVTLAVDRGDTLAIKMATSFGAQFNRNKDNGPYQQLELTDIESAAGRS